MKILKSKKALSPVVASIILIAVTVAVSIAVAAWMGALTFTFMGTEQAKITDIAFDTGVLRVRIHNTGTSPVTINEAWVNGVEHSVDVLDEGLPMTCPENALTLVNITYSWIGGYNYEVQLVSSQGNAFYRTETAPSS